MPKIIDNVAQKLTAEARKQINEVGYAAMNIRTVAKNCGVGVGTVYNYFPSKDALIASFLAEDWMQSLVRLQSAARSGQILRVLEAMYRELDDFLSGNGELFRSAAESVPGVPRQYHAMLRSQLSQVLRPMCPDDFTAEFTAEALLTWTVEGKRCPEILAILEKILA